MPGTSAGGPPWPGEILFLVLTAGYVGVILWVTSRRSSVTPATLAVGTGAGLLFGLVMYAVAPLGLGTVRHRSVAAGIAGRSARGARLDPAVRRAGGGRGAGRQVVPRAGRREAGPRRRIGQGIVAGVLATGTGALFVTVLGTGTTALTIRSAWLRHWLYHGHLSETRRVRPRDLRGQRT